MIENALSGSLESSKHIMLDSNIIISYLDCEHFNHKIVSRRLQELFINGSIFYFTQPVLLEVKNFWRLKLITSTIRFHLVSKKRLFRKFEECFLDFEKQNKGSNLKDWQLKILRKTLEVIHKGKGVEFWAQLCNQALSGKFAELISFLENSNFIYAKLNSEVYPIENKEIWPSWDNMDNLMERFGLSSNDAAILNMTHGAQKVDSFLTNDGDLLFAIAKNALPNYITAFTFLESKAY